MGEFCFLHSKSISNKRIPITRPVCSPNLVPVTKLAISNEPTSLRPSKGPTHPSHICQTFEQKKQRGREIDPVSDRNERARAVAIETSRGTERWRRSERRRGRRSWRAPCTPIASSSASIRPSSAWDLLAADPGRGISDTPIPSWGSNFSTSSSAPSAAPPRL